MADLRTELAQMLAQNAQQQPVRQTHPPIDLSDPKYDEIIKTQEGEIISPLEQAVDAYIAGRKMNMDDVFSVRHPGGDTLHYRYLGPNSGGRKDWMKIKHTQPDAVS
jgi:hypothetical protein